METGICPFFGWENGISCTGTGIHKKKNLSKAGTATTGFVQRDDGI